MTAELTRPEIQAPALTLRPAQAEILRYAGGPMAISAVPGAGKTFILEQLIAKLVADEGARPSEVLVLTYMRSAALNIKRRAAKTLGARGVTAFGLQATTIHAFALSIQRRARGEAHDERPITIMGETERRRILMTALERWLADPRRRALWNERFAEAEADGDDPVMAAVRLAEAVIAEAKHKGLAPDDVARILGNRRPEVPYLYREYLAAQALDDALDHDDSIREAVRLLRADADLRGWYQRSIRYVLEDEAQDSTPAQQELIDLVTAPRHGGNGNLIRVGDTNQAILSSFTYNDPRYFRAFCAECDLDGRHKPMPESSRSALPIIALANRLVDFVGAKHPDDEVRAAFTGQHVYPATAGKANPAGTSPCTWSFYTGEKKGDAPLKEMLGVLEHVRTYLKANPTRKAAVLVPSHKLRLTYTERALALGVALQPASRPGIATRPCLQLLQKVLLFLMLPSERQSEAFLAVVRAWAGLREVTFVDRPGIERFVAAHGPEALLYPAVGLPPARPLGVDPADYAAVLEVARALKAFLAARHLPAGELLPLIAQTLLQDPQGAAIAAKAAAIALREREKTPWVEGPLAHLLHELIEIERASGERGELVQPAAELAEPEGGRLAIMTMHAAKGQEFDAVWLPGLGYYKKGHGHYPWEVDNVDIWDREAFAFKAAMVGPGEAPRSRQDAELAARRLGVAEKLRLLYVGITRAERELHLSASGFNELGGLPPHVKMLADACERRHT